MNNIIKELNEYVYENIIPQYQMFDKGHNNEHITKVISSSFKIAKDYEVDINMIFVIAAYHDIGIINGRKNHHITSGIILANDKELYNWFSKEQIDIMKEAVEDHRASNDYEPRSIYGKIISEADRDINIDTMIYRTMEYGISHFPKLSFDEQFERLFSHIESKYGENGYLELWLKTEDNIAGLSEIRRMLKNKELMKSECKIKYRQRFSNI